MATNQDIFVPLSFNSAINSFVDKIVNNYGDALRVFSERMLSDFLVPLETLFRNTPAWLALIIVGALAYMGMKHWGKAIAIVFVTYLIGCFGLWDQLMQTLALMFIACLLAGIIGIPLGIAVSFNQTLRKIFLPILDIMQTLPTFVYLIPVVMLFGLGKVPAIMATIVYAVPPLVRLTDLGIRQVDKEIREAAWSFGTNKWQLLFDVLLPLAKPSIMTGINQMIMMALSMVVIASMIGARGLGENVLSGINTLDTGKGAMAGIAIVILAIVIDRITQSYGQAQRRVQVSTAK